MSFKDQCEINRRYDFEGLFLHSDNKIKNNNIIEFLTDELRKTRFHSDSLEIDFSTVALLNGVNKENIDSFWKNIQVHTKNFLDEEPNYDLIKSDLAKISGDDDQIVNAVNSIKQLYYRTQKTIESNINSIQVSFEKKTWNYWRIDSISSCTRFVTSFVYFS